MVELANPVERLAQEHRLGLLIFGLGRDKPHLGLARGDHDCLGIGCVVFLAFYERLDVLRRNELGLMAEIHHVARTSVRAAAGLVYDHAVRMFSREQSGLLAGQLLAEHHIPRGRCTVKLENALCQVHPDYGILYLAVLSALWFSDHHPSTSRCRLGWAATTPSYEDPSFMRSRSDGPAFETAEQGVAPVGIRRREN
jgi:hypothetical protein